MSIGTNLFQAGEYKKPNWNTIPYEPTSILSSRLFSNENIKITAVDSETTFSEL